MKPSILSIVLREEHKGRGFITQYPAKDWEITESVVLSGIREVFFYRKVPVDDRGIRIIENGPKTCWSVPLAREIKTLNGFHEQYGISISEKHGCFFIGGWIQGVFCCDLRDGHILWRYRLKQSTKVFVYDDYIICAFYEIGLRKLTFDGKEIGKYPMTTYDTCCRLNADSPYLFIGPRRNQFYIFDTESMTEIRTIPYKKLAPSGKEKKEVNVEGLMVLDANGTPDCFEITGREGQERFTRTIQL